MAEIKIEKKKPVWPWILLGVLLLAALIYFLVGRNDDNEVAVTETTVTTEQVVDPATGGSGDAVAQYVAFINSGQQIDETHEYTNGALQRLADAVAAKATQSGYNVQSDLDRVRQVSSEIAQDPQSLSHANKIHSAATTLGEVMVKMQQAKYPNLGNEAGEVQQAARSIRPDQPTLEQKDALNTFFERSGQLLQKMS